LKRPRYAHASRPDSTSAVAFCATLLCITVTVCCAALTPQHFLTRISGGKRDSESAGDGMRRFDRRTQTRRQAHSKRQKRPARMQESCRKRNRARRPGAPCSVHPAGSAKDSRLAFTPWRPRVAPHAARYRGLRWHSDDAHATGGSSAAAAARRPGRRAPRASRGP
jgi:hypothetical protein